MKILHWAIILVIIVLPIAIVCMINVNSKLSALKDEVRINNAIDTATQDAIDQLKSLNSSVEYSGRFGDVLDVTPAVAQEVIDTFFHTLGANFNLPYQQSGALADTNYGYIKNYFSSYVPVVMVIAYDGFYVYSLEDDGSGYIYKLSSKIPFVRDYEFNGTKYSVGYTLGNDIYLYYNGKCYSGALTANSKAEMEEKYNKAFADLGVDGNSELIDSLSVLSNDMSVMLYALHKGGAKFKNSIFPDEGVTNFIQDYGYENNSLNITEAGPFHIERRNVIVDIVTQVLSQEINDHQNYANVMGITYDFSFPTLSRQDWMNTIEDISVFAFVQGIPIGNASGSFYNNFALGGSKIVRSIGYTITYDGTHYYYHEPNCPTLPDITDDRIFQYGVKNKYEAATSYGAYPCLVCN